MKTNTICIRWTQKPVTDEVAFEAIKASIDSVPAGSKMVLNSGTYLYNTTFDVLSNVLIGEFYGNAPNVTTNLELISRFFEKYPDYADRAFLSVKVSYFCV